MELKVRLSRDGFYFSIRFYQKRSRNFLGAAFSDTITRIMVTYSTIYPGYLVILSASTCTNLTAWRIWRINVNAMHFKIVNSLLCTTCQLWRNSNYDYNKYQESISFSDMYIYVAIIINSFIYFYTYIYNVGFIVIKEKYDFIIIRLPKANLYYTFFVILYLISDLMLYW